MDEYLQRHTDCRLCVCFFLHGSGHIAPFNFVVFKLAKGPHGKASVMTCHGFFPQSWCDSHKKNNHMLTSRVGRHLSAHDRDRGRRRKQCVCVCACVCVWRRERKKEKRKNECKIDRGSRGLNIESDAARESRVA